MRGSRWRGDDGRICAQQIDDNAPREYGISCHRCAWLDDRSLVFYLNGPLRMLDLDTGESSTLLKSLVTAARGRKFGNRTLDRYLGGRVSEVEESCEAVHVADGRIWFAALLFSLSFRWWWLPRFSGVFSVDRDGGDLQFVASVPKQELIKDLIALTGGSAVLYTERYRRMTVIDRPRRPVGPLADFLAEGWDPVLTSCEAAFGFHTLPGASDAAYDPETR